MAKELPAAAANAINAAADRRRFATVTLDNPLKRGDQEITKVTLRKPMGGDLTGTNLGDLYNMNVNAMAKIIPRISDPMIHAPEFMAMDGEDIAALSGKVVGFFADEAAKGGGWTGSVDDAFADIAIIFHWSLAEMSAFELSELMQRRNQAVNRWNAMNAPPKS